MTMEKYNRPKYTFLLPAFKSRYLEETLVSIKEQSYKYFKVIVSDDCSPEDIRLVFTDTVGNDDRFSYRRNKENMGSRSLVSHWNLLLNMCDTDYLIIASDDDVYSIDFLEKVDKLISCYPTVNIFRGRVRRIDENSQPIADEACLEELQSNIDYLYYSGGNRFIQCMSNYVFKTKTIQGYGGVVDFPLAWFSDKATVQQMLVSDNKIVNTTDPVFFFRTSTINISGQTSNEKNIYNWCLAAIEYYHWFNHYIESVHFDNALIYQNKRHAILTNARDNVLTYLDIYCDAVNTLKAIKMFKAYKDSHIIPYSNKYKGYIVKVLVTKLMKKFSM